MSKSPGKVPHYGACGDFMGVIMSLGMEKRGHLPKPRRWQQTAPPHLPISPQRDHHRLQRQAQVATRGYGSFDYEFEKYELGDIVNSRSRQWWAVDAFSCLSTALKPKEKDDHLRKARRSHPHEQFKVPIKRTSPARLSRARPSAHQPKTSPQSATAATSSRKRKLWEKQKKAKSGWRDRQSHIPQSAFMSPQSRRIAMSAVTFFQGSSLCEQQYTLLGNIGTLNRKVENTVNLENLRARLWF